MKNAAMMPALSVIPDIHPPAVNVEAPIPPTGNALPKPETFLRLPEVISRTGMCRATIYRREGFPKPVKIGTSSMWVASEIDAWIAHAIATSRRAA
jgi:prophage regulatory protein